jgi:hypothetical protein
MDATPIDFGAARPLARPELPMGINAPFPSSTAAHAATWAAIHEAAATVGAIAGLDQERIAAEIARGLDSDLATGGELDSSVQDLAEILRRGISALLTAHVSGGAPHAAAQALWREFLIARESVTGSPLGHVARSRGP